MIIKNLGNLLQELKPLLRQYLEDYGTQFSKTHFQCPNRSQHNAEDSKEACNFYPDDEHFKCFVCNSSGDIFNATHLLEGRPISGKGFITDNVLYLADKYNITYETEEESEEEKVYNNTQQLLETIIKSTHQYLIEKKPKELMLYLKDRQWGKIVKSHKLGYLPKSDKVEKQFNLLLERYNEKIQYNGNKYINLSYKGLSGRLLYPLMNAYGLVVGISSRRLDDSNKKISKYLHSVIKRPNVPVNVLYNLNNARHSSKIYLVEGASSVFTLQAHGIENVVAIMGSNFVDKHYEWLLKNSIKELVLCFDGDDAGIKALHNAINIIQHKSGIKIGIKELPNNLDPDDYIKKHTPKEFIELEETPLFMYQLKSYLEFEDDKSRESLFALLVAESDALKQEKLLNIFVSKTKMLKTNILKELEKYENKNKLTQGISTAEYLEEGIILEKEVDIFDELRWKTNELIGLKTNHLMFDEQMDGLQVGLHMVGGRWNIGKSVFCLDLALKLIQDENNYVLYFSIDDPTIFKTIPRIIANLSGVNINLLVKPKHGINENETIGLDQKKEMIDKSAKALILLKSYSNRFSLKDAKYGQDLFYILKKIRLCKQRALDQGNKNLIVFIDFLHMIKTKGQQETEKLIEISKELKRAASIYECPIVTTVMGTKSGMESKNLKDDSIKGAVELQYMADAIYLLESDFYDDKGKMYFYDDDGESRPIISLNVSKNKLLSGFKGKIFYRFYGELMRYEECDEEEQLKFRKTRGINI